MTQIDPYILLNSKEKNIALVGATNDKNKYGNIIFHNLLNKKYPVYPVNPRADEIDGHLCYRTLEQLHSAIQRIDIINIVLPPKLGLDIIDQCVKLHLDNLWFQPGAQSEEVIRKCDANGLHYSIDACIMVVSRH